MNWVSLTVLFQLFRWEELELLICGNPVLDFEELQSGTIYDNGYHEDHPAIKYAAHYQNIIVKILFKRFFPHKMKLVVKTRPSRHL